MTGGSAGTVPEKRVSPSSVAGPVVRTFGWGDWPEVQALWQNAGPGVHLGRSDTPVEIRKKWEHDPDLFLVAVDRGHVVGAVLGGYDGRRGLIYHLAVAPGCRRAGLGRELMAEMERRLAGKGCVKSYLLAAPENGEAVAFYRKLGWQVMEMVLMGKELE